MHFHHYYPDTKSLVDMHATFDMTAGTVSFTINHLSTFVFEQGKAVNPKTGDDSSPLIPITVACAAATTGFAIVKKRATWKVKKASGK